MSYADFRSKYSDVIIAMYIESMATAIAKTCLKPKLHEI